MGSYTQVLSQAFEVIPSNHLESSRFVMTPSRSTVRTNIVIFAILGFVVALLVHFVVLSTPTYNWFAVPAAAPAGLLNNATVALGYVATLI
jgi:light-harvesting complex 1 alpha chain